MEMPDVSAMEKGLIFDIQAYSVHDGPGTRTLIFMNGCPLRCEWCANPEGQMIRQRMMFKEQSCKNCPRRCVEACPIHAVRPSQEGPGLVAFDHTLCDMCEARQCIAVCYMQALQLSGKWYSVDDLMKVLTRDRCYWGSKGGVTLSGGEPLMQKNFVVELLRRCHEAYIGACVETSGHVPRATLEAVAPYVQWFFIDVKHMDTLRHREGTGVDNKLILDNIRWLANHREWSGRLMLRMPVIPGFNDSFENARATASFMKECGLGEINLLPFHRLGSSKHHQLGTEYRFENLSATKPEDLSPLAEIYRLEGLKCYIGSNTPF